MIRKPCQADPDKAFNVRLGAAIRSRRKELGITLRGLGNSLGLSYQQVQKHERGATAMTVDRLIKVSRVLKLPLTHFLVQHSPALGCAEEQQPFADDIDMGTELSAAFMRVTNPVLRERIVALVKSLAGPEDRSSRPRRNRPRAAKPPQ